MIKASLLFDFVAKFAKKLKWTVNPTQWCAHVAQPTNPRKRCFGVVRVVSSCVCLVDCLVALVFPPCDLRHVVLAGPNSSVPTAEGENSIARTRL